MLAIVAMALAGLGSRWGWWTFRTGFSILRWGGYAALLGAALTLLGAFVRRTTGRTVAAAVLVLAAFATVAVPWSWRRTAQRVPPIHDITTDTADPPLFVALLPARDSAPNGSRYAGDSIASLQAAAY
ncbi:MAG TPA: hypothetical protein VFX50_01170, partial [Gemmatimonadales bacterium]|nr:hypothetical protein [Gemmatimonadales bacterium]